MATTTSSPAGDFLAAAIGLVENDALKVYLPLVQGFLTSISGNPSTVNIMAQIASFEAQALAALPSLEQAVVKDLVMLLQAQIAKLTPAAPAA